MKIYIEAIETGVEDGEFHQEETTIETQETALSTINAALDVGKTYTKRVHYCRQTTDNPCENKPCVIEEIVADVITNDKKPRVEVIADDGGNL